MKKTANATNKANVTHRNMQEGGSSDVMDAATETRNKSSESKNNLLEQLFLNLLQDIYWAEEHLEKMLQSMKEAATTEELEEAFEDHLLATQKHKSRLQKVFQLIGKEAKAKKCDAMEGLTKEAQQIINETKENTMTRDAALIIAAQKIEHYEIAAYGSLVQLALTLGYGKAADLLERTLWEEEDTDQLLTSIAEEYINPMADREGEDNETYENAALEEENA